MSKKAYIKPSIEAMEIELTNKYAFDMHSSVGTGQYVKGEKEGTDDGSSFMWDTSSLWDN